MQSQKTSDWLRYLDPKITKTILVRYVDRMEKQIQKNNLNISYGIALDILDRVAMEEGIIPCPHCHRKGVIDESERG